MWRRGAAASDKNYKLSDCGGLHLFGVTTGRRTWRWTYRFGGKERRMVFGGYPDIPSDRRGSIETAVNRLPSLFPFHP